MSYQIWGAGFGDPAAEGPPGVVPCEVGGADGVSRADEVAGAGGATGVGGTGLAPGASHEGGGPAYGVTALFRDHHAELVRLAVLMTGDRGSAEDIVQDVFARLCTRDYLPEAGGALAYARAAVLNGCRDGPAVDVTQRSAESEVLLAEDRRQVLAALAGLSRRRREVLVLRYWLGLPEAEIAAVLGISPGTVKSTAARGIAALARRLGESA